MPKDNWRLRRDWLEILHSSFRKQYAIGVYRGRVEYNQDPLGLGRVKVRVPKYHGQYNQTPLDKLPWAWPAFPIKTYSVPEVGDFVWVVFEDGDPLYPLYLGQWYPIHKEKKLYGIAKGREDVDNTIDKWYPDRDKRLYSAEDGYHLLGSTYPPEVLLAQDLDHARERVVCRTPKGASVYISDQDDFERLEILDRAGQGIRMKSPGKEPSFGKRFLESSYESDRFGYGIGKSKLELKGNIKSKISLESTPEGNLVRIGFKGSEIVLNETTETISLSLSGGVNIVFDAKTQSLLLQGAKITLASDVIDLTAKKVNIVGDLEVVGEVIQSSNNSILKE